jgi:hypothetical protein
MKMARYNISWTIIPAGNFTPNPSFTSNHTKVEDTSEYKGKPISLFDGGDDDIYVYKRKPISLFDGGDDEYYVSKKPRMSP